MKKQTFYPKEVVGSEGHLFRLLRKKYLPEHYVLLRQIRSSAAAGSRTADAVAVGTWKSRDCLIHGFEIKSSRTSWLQELQNPAKAEEIAQYCHFWWVAASSSKIVNPEELPRGWGLYVLDEGALKVIVPALQLEPRALDSTFVASLLKGAVDQGLTLEKEAVKENAYEEGYKQGLRDSGEKARKQTAELIEQMSERLRDAGKLRKEFEGMLGVSLDNLKFEEVKELKELFAFHKAAVKYFSGDRIKELLQAYRFLATGPVQHTIEELTKVSLAASEVNVFIRNKIAQLPKIEEIEYSRMAQLRQEAAQILKPPTPKEE